MITFKKFFALSVLLVSSSSFLIAHSLPAGEGDGRGQMAPAEEIRIPHTKTDVHGWTVFVDKALLEGAHSEEGELALEVLRQRLHRITMRLPEAAWKEMCKVPIYLDQAHPLGNAHFHPSKNWLEEHGYDPAMGEAVHFTHARSLINDASMPNRGSVVLHELAHAYHFKVLGFDDEAIIAGYQKFCDSEKFDAVTYPQGRQRPHYGLMDHKEFFAEMTETFFTENNTFPFNRTELMLYYPEGYQLLAELWKVKVPKARGKWETEPTAWDLRMMSTLKAQRGQFEEALEMVSKAQILEPKNQRLQTLREKLEAEQNKAKKADK